MISLIQLDSAYRETLQQIPQSLQKTYKSHIAQGMLPLEGTELSKAILLRLQSFYQSQDKIKKFLGKKIAGAGSDFFVETVLFYLQVLNESHHLNFEVKSEITLQAKRGAPRPDISIWQNGKLIVAIECKTQLGYARNDWKERFNLREQQLQSYFPESQIYLLIMTTANGPKDFHSQNEVGKQFFALLNEWWPTDINLENLDKIIFTGIEPLFQKICSLSKT